MTCSVLRADVLPILFCRIYAFGHKSLTTDVDFDIFLYLALALFVALKCGFFTLYINNFHVVTDLSFSPDIQ
jgi:hypothetical protein